MNGRAIAHFAALGLALAAVANGCAAGARLSEGPATATAPAGAALLARRCSGCHARPDPATMTHARWLDGLERMKRRMRLPAAEWDSLAALSSAESGP